MNDIEKFIITKNPFGWTAYGVDANNGCAVVTCVRPTPQEALQDACGGCDWNATINPTKRPTLREDGILYFMGDVEPEDPLAAVRLKPDE